MDVAWKLFLLRQALAHLGWASLSCCKFTMTHRFARKRVARSAERACVAVDQILNRRPP
jgi:hypothetical protein